MASLFTRKEINWGLIFQGITLVVSLFAGLMAYNASLSSAKLSGELSKDNEKETRVWNQRSQLYSSINNVLKKFENYSGDNLYEYVTKLRLELDDFKSELRLIGTQKVIYRIDCLMDSLKFNNAIGEDMLILELFNEEQKERHTKYQPSFEVPRVIHEQMGDKTARDILEIPWSTSAYDYIYMNRIRPNVFFIQKQIREELFGTGNEIELYPIYWESSQQQGQTEDEFKVAYNLAEKCEKINTSLEEKYWNLNKN